MTKYIPIPVLAAATGVMLSAVPAQAAPSFNAVPSMAFDNGMEASYEHGKHKKWKGDHRHGYGNRIYYEEPIRHDTRVWRGSDGRYHCRRSDGTVGLIIGGAAGALIGREIDGGRDRTTGTILGAAGGALLGRSIARDGGRCR